MKYFLRVLLTIATVIILIIGMFLLKDISLILEKSTWLTGTAFENYGELFALLWVVSLFCVVVVGWFFALNDKFWKTIDELMIEKNKAIDKADKEYELYKEVRHDLALETFGHVQAQKSLDKKRDILDVLISNYKDHLKTKE